MNTGSTSIVVPAAASGTKLMRATGTLVAFTTPAQPAVFSFMAQEVPADTSVSGTFIANGTPYAWSLNNGDSSPMDYITAGTALLSYILQEIGSTASGNIDSGGNILIVTNAVGADQSLAIQCDVWSLNLSVTGVDDSGGTQEAVLYTGNGSSGAVLMQGGWFDGGIGGGVNVGLYLRTGSGDTQISSWDTPDHCAAFVPLTGNLADWFGGLNQGESLVAKLVNGTMPTDGSSCNVGVIFQLA